MTKRILWVGVGIAAGIVIATKASAYVKAYTPKAAREFVLGPDQTDVPIRTLAALWGDFLTYQHEREDELNRQFIARSKRR